MWTLLSLLVAASPSAPADYARAREALQVTRAELQTEWKRDPAATRREARRALLAYLEGAAFPAWEGTAWDFSGMSTTPREGKIACGYYVSTVLEQAGFQVQRIRLAQQASAYVVSTLARGTRVETLRPADNAAAVESIRLRFGDGLYVVGFDYHVGFLRLEGTRAAFCHSSYLDPGTVTCEDPVPSGAFVSRTYVVADALNDRVLDDWILGRAIPTQRPPRR